MVATSDAVFLHADLQHIALNSVSISWVRSETSDGQMALLLLV